MGRVRGVGLPPRISAIWCSAPATSSGDRGATAGVRNAVSPRDRSSLRRRQGACRDPGAQRAPSTIRDRGPFRPGDHAGRRSKSVLPARSSSTYADLCRSQIRPLGKVSPVVIDPLVRFGRPAVSGVATERLWELFDAGESVEEIAAGYELSARSTSRRGDCVRGAVPLACGVVDAARFFVDENDLALRKAPTPKAVHEGVVKARTRRAAGGSRQTLDDVWLPAVGSATPRRVRARQADPLPASGETRAWVQPDAQVRAHRIEASARRIPSWFSNSIGARSRGAASSRSRGPWMYSVTSAGLRAVRL